jgi:pyruvate dehydrogenase (quinone)
LQDDARFLWARVQHDGSAIIDAVVVANELPNMPHLELEVVGQYALATIKEAVLAITDG